MRYGEFTKKDLKTLTEGFIDPNQDELGKQHAGETRKPKLTLQMLNKLKKIRATNDLETVQKGSLLGTMYGMPDPEDEDAGDF